LPPSVTSGPAAGEAQQFADELQLTYSGATRDLSRIFFQVQRLLWPEDTTQPINAVRSLYEYAGVGNSSPSFVGVDDEGRLISDCGTALGSMWVTEYGADVYNAVSEDGETVFFTAAGQGLNGCGESHAPAGSELFARVGHGVGARTVGISEPSAEDCEVCQISSVGAAEFQGASRDGSKVFFLTEQELFKEDTGTNLYEYDFSNRPGHKVIRVSIGSKEPHVQGVARVSEDGSHVYFVARGALTSGPNAEGDEPILGGENLYVFERDAAYPSGHLTFVATLSEVDSEHSFGGDWTRRDARPVQATPDGRYLVFQSVADLTGNTSGVPQIFEYDASKERLVRVSVGEPGYATGVEAAEAFGGQIEFQKYVKVAPQTRASTELVVSNDGSVVEFESRGGLTRQSATAGVSGVQSVFEYRSVSGDIANGRVFLVSDGNSEFNAVATGTDAAGTDAFFETGAPVLASDGDTQIDIYDARDDGGFALSGVGDCVKEGSCHGSAGMVSSSGSAGSASAAAGDNAPFVEPPSGAGGVPTLSRAQKLAKALKACRRKARRGSHGRRACEAGARRRYGPVKAKGRG